MRRQVACRTGRVSVDDAGFSLVELLVASVLAMAVMGGVLLFVSTQVPLARAQTDAGDLQQRARAVADILGRAIAEAGAWADAGGPPGASLACCVPVVLPRRLGTTGADAPTVARQDVLTTVAVAPAVVPGRLLSPLPGDLRLAQADGCPPARPVCGLREGAHVVIFEWSGRHDFVMVGPPGSDAAPVTARQAASVSSFAAGAFAVGVETRTYYFDAARRQLRVYDGYRSDMAIVDDVEAVAFEYWGAPGAPATARGDAGAATCWFDADGVPVLAAEPPPGTANVRMPIETLADGPWCGSGGNTFDADLLRIRSVRVTVRLAASADDARGRGPAFFRPGRAVDARRLVPDMEVIIDATPRALGAAY